jgi:hypothetical protein
MKGPVVDECSFAGPVNQLLRHTQIVNIIIHLTHNEKMDFGVFGDLCSILFVHGDEHVRDGVAGGADCRCSRARLAYFSAHPRLWTGAVGKPRMKATILAAAGGA